MPLDRYLGEEKLELLKREVKSSTGIQFKTLSRSLISDNRLRKIQIAESKRGSAIVITVKGEVEAKKLCTSGLQFDGLVKVVEKFLEVGPSSVCMTCCGICHKRMGSCGNRPVQYTICSRVHKVEDHQCGVVKCTKSKGKVCPHIKMKCANFDGSHMASSIRYISRPKASIKANKKKAETTE